MPLSMATAMDPDAAAANLRVSIGPDLLRYYRSNQCSVSVPFWPNWYARAIVTLTLAGLFNNVN